MTYFKQKKGLYLCVEPYIWNSWEAAQKFRIIKNCPHMPVIDLWQSTTPTYCSLLRVVSIVCGQETGVCIFSLKVFFCMLKVASIFPYKKIGFCLPVFVNAVKIIFLYKKGPTKMV